MKEAKRFLTVDFYIQTIVGIACVLLSFALYGIILLLPFGIWQVISSIVLVLIYKDKKRVPHLIFVAIWGAILGILMLIGVENFPFYFFYIILLPAGVGIWYYTITRNDYLLVKGNKGVSREEMEEILDFEL